MFPKPVRREVLLLLGAKVLALAVIWFVFFAPFVKPEPDHMALQKHILSDQAR